ncbi:LacI family DNA-binding transcriptional regulator [Pararhodonellum marinum]|uniref:LacI family DNA-binding transcriptional regulator n=1 Tax=Pararhodonellum marinum TaxID=2755358 RepID=UPI00188EB61A|nr:LacI family DNA-binding transcriptional regulator [Pararhodonellum marinum]
MKIGQATIKDIAKALNVSSSTVSRALKDYPGISDETKRKVKELADKWNYRPNAVALSLRKSKSFTIGVIIPEVVHFFFSTVISGIEEVAFMHGYNVILCQTNEKLKREISSVETIISNQIDGLLVSFSKETTNFDHFKRLIEQHYPVVFFDRIPNLENSVNITVNDYQGAFDATKHLISQGYKDILHLAGPRNLDISKNRMNGYMDALKEAEMPVKPHRIIECPEGVQEESFKICAKVFKEQDRPDAIFANNDMAAAGAMRGVKSLGLKIPEDVGVVGFSNWQFSSMVDPPLSTVSQPGFKIGERATQLLIEMIEQKGDEPFTPKLEILETELLIRGSSVR